MSTFVQVNVSLMFCSETQPWDGVVMLTIIQDSVERMGQFETRGNLNSSILAICRQRLGISFRTTSVFSGLCASEDQSIATIQIERADTRDETNPQERRHC